VGIHCIQENNNERAGKKLETLKAGLKTYGGAIHQNITG